MYRIKIEKNKVTGEIRYRVQKRELFIWWNEYISVTFNRNNPAVFSLKRLAEEFIEKKKEELGW